MNFSTNPIWQLVAQSDAMTFIVLALLLSMSILCWTVFFYKWFIFRTKERQVYQAVSLLQEVQTLEELKAVVTTLSSTVPGYILKKALTSIKNIIESHPECSNISEKELELVKTHIEQSIEDILHWQESYLPILYSCASVSPLLGLFGTIWGLVHSFVRIAQKQSADITTVAPGIAEALITTLAGLLVAIPALIMYHYLAHKLRVFEHNIIKMSDRGLVIIQLLFT